MSEPDRKEDMHTCAFCGREATIAITELYLPSWCPEGTENLYYCSASCASNHIHLVIEHNRKILHAKLSDMKGKRTINRETLIKIISSLDEYERNLALEFGVLQVLHFVGDDISKFFVLLKNLARNAAAREQEFFAKNKGEKDARGFRG